MKVFFNFVLCFSTASIISLLIPGTLIMCTGSTFVQFLFCTGQVSLTIQHSSLNEKIPSVTAALENNYHRVQKEKRDTQPG